jgi:hypothetical protein
MSYIGNYVARLRGYLILLVSILQSTGEVEITTTQNPHLLIETTVSVHKSKKIAQLLKIEILENNSECCPETGSL